MSISARSGGLPWAASGREANEGPHQAAGEVEVLGHGLVKFLLIDLEHSDRLGRYGRLCMSFAREQRQSATRPSSTRSIASAASFSRKRSCRASQLISLAMAATRATLSVRTSRK